MNILWCFTNICFKKRRGKQQGTIKQSKSKSRCINKNLPEPKQTHNTEQRVFPRQFLSKTRTNTPVRSPAPTYFRSFLLSTSGCNGGPEGEGPQVPTSTASLGPLPAAAGAAPWAELPAGWRRTGLHVQPGTMKNKRIHWPSSRGMSDPPGSAQGCLGSAAHGDQTSQEELLQTSLAGKNPYQRGASWNLGLETSSLQFSFQSAAILSKKGQNQSETFQFTHTFTPVHKHRSCHRPAGSR